MEITEENAKTFWRSRGIPEEALDSLWTLSQRVRSNDAISEEHSGEHGEGVKKVLGDSGWPTEAVVYMAEQRAIRAIVGSVDGREALAKITGTNVPKVISGIDPKALTFVMSVWIDGFAIGVKN